MLLYVRPQVVVMKVAIHCQGCAGKVRKHISKMEGMYYVPGLALTFVPKLQKLAIFHVDFAICSCSLETVIRPLYVNIRPHGKSIQSRSIEVVFKSSSTKIQDKTVQGKGM